MVLLSMQHLVPVMKKLCYLLYLNQMLSGWEKFLEDNAD